MEEADKDLLMRIGLAVLLTQTVERSVRFVMTLVIQKKGGLDYEKWMAQEEAEADKTIGYFLAQMRHRVEVDPEFDDMLTHFHALRNALVVWSRALMVRV